MKYEPGKKRQIIQGLILQEDQCLLGKRDMETQNGFSDLTKSKKVLLGTGLTQRRRYQTLLGSSRKSFVENKISDELYIEERLCLVDQRIGYFHQTD